MDRLGSKFSRFNLPDNYARRGFAPAEIAFPTESAQSTTTKSSSQDEGTSYGGQMSPTSGLQQVRLIERRHGQPLHSPRQIFADFK